MTRLGNIKTAAATLVVAAAVLVFSAAAGAGASRDETPPTGALDGVQSPASGTLELSLHAADSGWGLAEAEASLGGAGAFVRLGSGSCPEHPTAGEPEPPPGACPVSVSAVPLDLDTRSLPDGEHRLVVRVTDAAANTATLLDREIVVRNAPPAATGPIATITIGLGGGQGGGHPPPPPPPGPPEGVPLCRSPRLRMKLASRPLWRTAHRVPVLRYRRRYLFRGRLSCLRSGHRVAAPRGSVVRVLYRAGGHTFIPHRHRMRVRGRGRLRSWRAFAHSRLIIFRYRSPSGEVARVRLRVAVARAHPSRGRWR